MYFVVYIRSIRQNRVVPHVWINKISDHIEKFINLGLKRNQIFEVFWTNNPEAFDLNGAPLRSFEPNFHIGKTHVFPHEGLYDCQLVSFRSK